MPVEMSVCVKLKKLCHFFFFFFAQGETAQGQKKRIYNDNSKGEGEEKNMPDKNIGGED